MQHVPSVDGCLPFDFDELLRSELSLRYELTGVLGRGGYGTVYRAVHRNTGQNVAVKVLRTARDWSPSTLEKQVARFEREASLCAELLHPNIVRLLERGQPNAGVCFAIYEYVPGRTLAHRLAEQGPLPVIEAAEVMAQVLDALACAHARGIVHRDLKPENIMIVEGGQRVHVKVLDFGVGTLVPAARSQDYRDLTLTCEAVGTPSYSAPEQLRGEPPTPKTDIYAWGLVLLECLTGRPVFEGATLASIYHQQLSPQEVALPSAMAGHPLSDFLRRVLQKQPARRAGDAAQLYRDFRALNVGDLVGDLRESRAPNHIVSGSAPPTVASPLVPEAAELRHVTVLSCSVSVAAEPHAKADFEVLDALQLEQGNLCNDTLVRYGGQLTWSVCDRRIVYFGFPSASDTDARRAARTALELAEEVRRRSAQLQEHCGVGLTFRVGLHSGMLRCDRLEQLPTGLTPSTAMRIEAVAPPNTIVVSEPARKLLAQHAEFRALPELSARSAIEPLPLYALLGELHADSLNARVGRERPGRLWGRDDELKALHERFRSAAEQDCVECVLLSGEAGVGKSRLLRELRRGLMEQDVVVCELRCTADARNTALAPVLAFLRRHWNLVRSAPEQGAERVCAALDACGLDTAVLAPIFCAWLLLPCPTRFAVAPAYSPLRQRQLLLHASAHLVCALHKERTGLVLVEDLHWADPTTIEWLDVLCKARASLLVVMTTRPGASYTFEQATPHRMEVPRLSPDDCLGLIRELCAEHTNAALNDEVLTSLAERADGVPLFAEELTRALYAADDLGHTQPPRSPTAIPDSLRELLSERLDRLGPAREIAQVAAAIGREFDTSLLQAALGYDEPVLEGLLERLVSADLVRRKRQIEQASYVFRHALVRDAAYDSMPRELRRSAHARIATALEREPEQARRLRSADLFRHFSAAQAHGPAARYGLLAGREALARSDNGMALKYARSVLDAIVHVPEPERRSAQLAAWGLITQALLATEGWASKGVRDAIERTRALLPPDDTSAEQVSLLYALVQHYHVASERSACRSVVAQLSRLADARGDATVRAIAATIEGVCFHAEGKFDEAHAHLERARSLYEPEPEGAPEGNGLDSYAWASAQLALVEWWRGDAERAHALGSEAIAWARRLRHVPSLAIALLYVGQVHQFEGDREGAITTCDELLSLATTYGLPAFEAYAAAIRAWADDDLDGVLAITNTLRSMNCNLILTYYGSFLADIEQRRGRCAEALAHVDDCLRLCTEIDEHCFEAELHRRRAALLLQQSRPDAPQAELALERSIQLARAQGMRRIEAMASADLSRLRSVSAGASLEHITV